jgi:hypothetical protein
LEEWRCQAKLIRKLHLVIPNISLAQQNNESYNWADQIAEEQSCAKANNTAGENSHQGIPPNVHQPNASNILGGGGLQQSNQQQNQNTQDNNVSLSATGSATKNTSRNIATEPSYTSERS